MNITFMYGKPMIELLYNNGFNINKHAVSSDMLIEKYIKTDNLQGFILILPTSKYVSIIKKQIARKYYDFHKKPISHLNVFRFMDFVKFCYDKINPDKPYRIISESFRLALIEEASEKAKLEYFRVDDKKLSIPTLKRINDIIYGIKEDGFTPLDLEIDLEKAEMAEEYQSSKVTDKRKLSDIMKIFRIYNELLNDSILDEPELLNKLNDQLTEGTSPSSLYDYLKVYEESPIDYKTNHDLLDKIFQRENVEIVLEGFYDFKEPEIRFLSFFTKSHIPLAINLDFSDNNGPLFSIIKDSRTKLLKQGFNSKSWESETFKTPEYLPANNDKDIPNSLYLRRRLFWTENEVKNPNFTKFIKIIQTEDRNDEILSITKLIKSLILKDKYKPDEICVCVNRPDLYTPLFREVFSKNKVPADISDRFHLDNSQVVNSIVNCLDMLKGGITKAKLQKALLSPYITLFNDDSEFNANNLFNISIQLRLSSFSRLLTQDYWIEKIKFEIAKNEKLITGSSVYFDDMDEVRHIEKNIKNLKQSLKDFKYLVEKLPFDKASQKMSVDDFSKLIQDDIIIKLNVIQNIKKAIIKTAENKKKSLLPDFEIVELSLQKETLALQSFIDSLDEMMFVLNERNQGEKYHFEDLLDKFKTAISGARYQLLEKPNYGVAVTAIQQTRGIPYKVMILCGALDNEFPGSYKPDKFLGKELLYSEEKKLKEQRGLFYQFLINNPEALDKGEKKIFIFYPAFQNDEQLVRSPFVDALLKITDLKENLINLENLRKSRKVKQEIEEEKNSDTNYDDLSWVDSYTTLSDVLKLHGVNSYNQIIGNHDVFKIALNQILDSEYIFKLTQYSVNQFHNWQQYVTANLSKEGLPLQFDINRLSDKSKDKLKSFQEKAYSISELEKFADCGYKHFITNILWLNEIQNDQIELSSLEIGNLMHKIFYKFFTQLQRDQLPAEKLTKIPVVGKVNIRLCPNPKDLLNKIAIEEINYLDFKHPFFNMQKNEILGTKFRTGLLEVWLNNQLSRNETALPAIFEINFGRNFAANANSIPPVDLGGILLKGKVDRVEFEEENVSKIIIADYKSSCKNIKSFSSGEAFQMPLYLLAMLKLFENGAIETESGNPTEAGYAIYYFYKPTNKNPEKKVLEKDRDKILSDTKANAIEIVKQISTGNFSIAPKRNCSYCNYAGLCKKNQLVG